MERSTARRIRTIGLILFLLYAAGLIYFLFFAEQYGRAQQGAAFRYNLIPTREIRRFIQNREYLGSRAVFLNEIGRAHV